MSHPKIIATLIVILVLLPATLAAQHKDPETGNNDWCFTQIYYDRMYGQTVHKHGCGVEGPCDYAGLRDAWIPDSTAPVEVIRVFFHVFAEDDGSNPAATPQYLAWAMDSLNSDYAQWHIQFVYDYEYHNNTLVRYLGSWDEFAAMHITYAVAPEEQCNIYVVSVNIDGSVFSMGTFPWDPNADGIGGGILMNESQFAPYNYSTLSHEMGHNLGLWHTFHGVDEVGQCGPCWESPNDVDRDSTGDYCSDTPPTPTNRACGPPGGTDPCTGDSWGETQPENIMSYAPWQCRTIFTQQQAGRMNCWLREELSGWILTVDMEYDTAFGPAGLEVDFTGVTPKNASAWYWDFGDGGTDTSANPSHIYNLPGIYDVTVAIESDEGPFSYLRESLIWTYADTITAPVVRVSTGESVPFPIYAANSLPLTQLEFPMSWGGDLDMDFDSITTTGLRTAFVENQGLAQYNPSGKQAVWRFVTSSADPIAPGSGPVAVLWLTCESSGAHGETSPISLAPYSGHEPMFLTDRGITGPVVTDGWFSICLPGDVDGNGRGPDIVDLTYFSQWAFHDGTAPVSLDATDVDRNGTTGDIADLIYLVEYIFAYGPPPPPCE